MSVLWDQPGMEGPRSAKDLLQGTAGCIQTSQNRKGYGTKTQVQVLRPSCYLQTFQWESLFVATSGAETIPRTGKSLASQDKVTLPLGKEPVFSLCSGVSPWDLEMLQDLSSP